MESFGQPLRQNDAAGVDETPQGVFGGRPEDFEFHYEFRAYIGVADYSVRPPLDRVETVDTDIVDAGLHFNEELTAQPMLARINFSCKIHCIVAALASGSTATVVKTVTSYNGVEA